MWVGTWSTSESADPMAMTQELSIRFLRPAIFDPSAEAYLYCRVLVNANSKRSAILTATMWTDKLGEDKPCSIAQGTYAFAREKRNLK